MPRSHLSSIAWLSVLVAATSLPTRTLAWDYGGHEIVATIAEARLNPQARGEVDAAARALSLPGRAYDAVTLSCWMDDLKKNELPLHDHGLFFTWHYIDLGAESGDPAPALVPGDDNPFHGNAVQALLRAQVVLRGGTDPYIKTRAEACALVMHLVGDLHQPLHAATHYFQTAGGWWHHDAGGTKEYVLNAPDGDQHFSLHRFWDSAWRARFDDFTGRLAIDSRFNNENTYDPAAFAEIIHSIKSATPVPNLEPDFAAWARESNLLARDFVYRDLAPTDSKKYCRLGQGYVRKANAIARERLLLAGERLAVLLNETLGAPSPPPHPPAYPAGPAGTFDPPR